MADSNPLLEGLINGLSESSILILTALGLAITFGVMKVINMAHGEMLMLGAYTAFVVTHPNGLPKLVAGVWNLLQLTHLIGPVPALDGLPTLVTQQWEAWGLPEWLGLSQPPDGLLFYAAIPICFLVTALAGYLLEVGLIRFLYGRPVDTLLATWGVSLVLQGAVRIIFGQDQSRLNEPQRLRGLAQIGDLTLPVPAFRLFVLGITALCVVAVYVWFYRTPFGLQIRAVTQNRAMAAALGVSTRRVDALTFAFGTGLAGVAGCIFAHLYTFQPNMGTQYIVGAFMVVILGGMGSLTGTVASGFVIGTSNALVAKPQAVLYVAILVLLYIVTELVRATRSAQADQRRWALWWKKGGVEFYCWVGQLVLGALALLLVGGLVAGHTLGEPDPAAEAFWLASAIAVGLALGLVFWLASWIGRAHLYDLPGFVGRLSLVLVALLFTEALGGNDQLARAWVVLVVIGFILYRPSGLFVTKERVYD